MLYEVITFLHLEKKGRTEMLMELFRLNRFDLFSNAARLSSRTAEQTAMIEGKLEGLSDATIEALDKAAEDYETLDKAAAELSVITSYSIHYTKLYESSMNIPGRCISAAVIESFCFIP